MVVRDALISYDWIYNGSAPKNIGERLNLTHYQSLEVSFISGFSVENVILINSFSSRSYYYMQQIP